MALASDLVQIGFSSKESDFIGDNQEASITATGVAQGTAYALSSNLNYITTVAAGVNDGVRLPAISSLKQTWWFIRNQGGANLNVYPATGEFINNQAVNTALVIANGTSNIFIPISSSRWLTR